MHNPGLQPRLSFRRESASAEWCVHDRLPAKGYPLAKGFLHDRLPATTGFQPTFRAFASRCKRKTLQSKNKWLILGERVCLPTEAKLAKTMMYKRHFHYYLKRRRAGAGDDKGPGLVWAN